MVSALETSELASLERKLESIAGKSGGDFQTYLDYLKTVRRLKLRKSQSVARYGSELLNDQKSRLKLGDEVWTVYEQVALASMDINDLEQSKKCIGALMIRFPGSLRVGRLEGMWLEAKGWYDQAQRRYSDLLDDNPTDPQLYKRKISILKSRGSTTRVIEALNAYLKMFMSDTDAWRELADQYISLQMFKQAAFCYEELIASNPLNPIFHLGYAEIYYTMGGLENLRIARKYYSAVIEQSAGNNMRALYGLCLCNSAITQLARTVRDRRDETGGDLANLAAQVIRKEYGFRCPHKLDVVKSSLDILMSSK